MPWLGFKGGKGLAVSGGALIVLNLYTGTLAFALLGLLALWTREADRASIFIFTLLPLLLWWQGAGLPGIMAGAAAAFLMLMRLRTKAAKRVRGTKW